MVKKTNVRKVNISRVNSLVCIYFAFSYISATQVRSFSILSLLVSVVNHVFIIRSYKTCWMVLCFYSFFVSIDSSSFLRGFCEIILLLIVSCSWYNWNTGRLDWPKCQSKKRNNQTVSTSWRSITLLSPANALSSNLLHSRFSG